MAKTYKPYQPEQDLLLPPSLKDWLPEKHLAYFVSEVVDELDRAGIEAVDGEEDERYGKECAGDELPEELQRRETRLKRIREAKRALEARAREPTKASTRPRKPHDAVVSL
jgi:hypothetical protein